MVTPLSHFATTVRWVSVRAIDWAAAVVAALWLLVAFDGLVLDAQPDADAVAILASASLAVVAAFAGTGSARAMGGGARAAAPIGARTAPRRPPRIIIHPPCCHCGRNPVRPRRRPRVVREPRHVRRPRLVPSVAKAVAGRTAATVDERYRRPPRIVLPH